LDCDGILRPRLVRYASITLQTAICPRGGCHPLKPFDHPPARMAYEGQSTDCPPQRGFKQMLDSTLINEYRRFRRGGRAARPAMALGLARNAIATGTTSPIGYASFEPCKGVGAPFTMRGDVCRWIDSPADHGLRMVGFADKVAPRSVRHTGWFLDDDGISRETARGVVFQLPARDGAARYVAGIADPFNNGPAVVCFDIADDETTAAHWADHLAERYAENERDHRRASNARLRFDELGEEVAQHRRDCLALIREIKARGAAFGPAICAALRDHVESHIRDIQKARATRGELFSNFARCDGWNA
jgi:hypothetical protein